MKESNKFLIIIIIVAIFSVAAVTTMGIALTQVAETIMPGNPNAEMKTETFNSTTMSVPVNSNFTEENGTYIDNINQIIIQVNNQGISESELQTYSDAFAKQFNATLINSTNLSNNTLALKGPSNETIIFVTSENQTVLVMAGNQDLAFKIAKSVKFNG